MMNTIKKSILISALLTVCASTSYADEVKKAKPYSGDLKETIRMSYLGEPASIDPQKVAGTWENAIMTQLFTGLYTNDAHGKAILGVAESHNISEDGLIHTFKIRPDAKWSDGAPVTAEDFVYSWKRLADPKIASPFATFMDVVKEAKAVDEKTLEVSLKGPTPYLQEMLVHYSSYAVPKHTVEKYGADWTKVENFVGNGAYVLVEWKPNTHIKMVKNPHFYDEKNVKIENIIFFAGEDRAAWAKSFRAGEVDYVDDSPQDQIDALRSEVGDQLHNYNILGVYFYAINNKLPKFADKRVRQALNMGIDREVLTQKVIKGGWQTAYSFVPVGANNYDGGPAMFTWKDLSQADKDTKAKALLKEAGYDESKPLSFELAYNTSENHKRVAVAVAQMWKKLGVNVTLKNQEVTPHYDALQEKAYEVGRAGWVADYNDPQTFLYLLQTKTAKQNYAGFSNPKFDELMDKAALTKDLATRAKIMKEAEQIALDESTIIPVMYYAKPTLVNKRVENWHDFKVGENPVRWLSLKP